MISLEDDGVTVEEGSLSEHNDENMQSTQDTDFQPMHEEVFSQTNIKDTEYNDSFRAKLKEPAQNCFMQRSARCCFTLWICGNLWCALQVACTAWIIIKTELWAQNLSEKSFGIRWGLISTIFGGMALYGLHRCVPEFILLYIGAFATAITAVILDMAIDSLAAHDMDLITIAVILLLMASGVWGSIVFYRIYAWANYFKHVKGGYDPNMRSPLIL